MTATVRELWPGARESAQPTPVTVTLAVQQYLAYASRAESAGAEHEQAATLQTLGEQLGPRRALAEITEGELAASLRHLWATVPAETWNQHRATVNTWLLWCATHPQWSAPLLPATCRPAPDEHTDNGRRACPCSRHGGTHTDHGNRQEPG